VKLFILYVLSFLIGVSAIAEECRDHLAQTVCIKTPDNHCVPDTAGLYYPKFQDVYDQLPPKLQAGLCAKKMIQVDNRMFNSAWAWFAFRADILKENLSLAHWASWKDQLSFSAHYNSSNPFQLSEELPKVRSTLPPEYRALYFIVVHEFGHALDADEKDFESWKAIDARPENTFPNKDKICIYSCREEPLPVSELPELYRNLMVNSLYLSLYGAGKGPGEDIPDTFAYWMVNKQNPEAEYWLELPNGDKYEVMSKLNSDRFKEKLEFVKKWYEQTNFVMGSPEMHFSMPVGE
jgi:hypothetical protein